METDTPASQRACKQHRQMNCGQYWLLNKRERERDERVICDERNMAKIMCACTDIWEILILPFPSQTDLFIVFEFAMAAHTIRLLTGYWLLVYLIKPKGRRKNCAFTVHQTHTHSHEKLQFRTKRGKKSTRLKWGNSFISLFLSFNLSLIEKEKEEKSNIHFTRHFSGSRHRCFAFCIWLMWVSTKHFLLGVTLIWLLFSDSMVDGLLTFTLCHRHHIAPSFVGLLNCFIIVCAACVARTNQIQ